MTYNISIGNNPDSGFSSTGGNPDVLTSTADNANVNISRITNSISSGQSVTVTTGQGGTGSGDIISSETGSNGILGVNGQLGLTLTFDAVDDINVYGFGGNFNIKLIARNAVSDGNDGIVINNNHNFDAEGSTFTAQNISSQASVGGIVFGALVRADTVVIQGDQGAVTQPGGTITANILTGSAASVALTQANSISALGAFTTNGAFTLTNSSALTLNGAQNAIGTLTIIDANAITQQAGATINAGSVYLSGTSLTLNDAISAATDTTLSSAGTSTVGGVLSGGGGLAVQGGGTFTLSAANSYTGGTTVSGGSTLAVTRGDALGSGTVTLSNGTLSNPTGSTLTNAFSIGSGGGTLSGGAFLLNGALSGTGDLTVAASIALVADNRGFSGATILNSGSLITARNANAFSGSSAFQVKSGATLDLNGFNETIASLSDGANGVSGGTVINNNAGASILTIGGSASTTFAGTIQNGSGTLGLTLAAGHSGTFTLSGANTYTGATTISGGTLQLGDGSAGNAGTLSASTAISLGDTTNGTGTLAIKHAGAFTLANTITGAGGLSQIGTGTTTLSGTDTYSGTTTILAGTLLVNGSISSSATTVQTGGTLGGSGTTGAVTVASGGFLSPGNSPGLLHTGSLALANGATYVEQIGGTTVGTQYDQTDVTGTVNLNSGNAAGGGATLNVSFVNGFTPTAGQSYVIINNDGNDAVQGTFAGLAEGANVTVNGVNLVISYRGGDGNDVTLSAPVPFTPPSGPTAVSDTASATFGRVLTATAPGVLANDSGSGGTLTVSAVNGQTANVGKAVLGTYGSLTLNGNGSYTYTNDATKTVFTGSVVDHFTYTDTANGQTATANLDITVSAPPASTLALFGTVVTNSASQTGSVYALYEGLLGRAPDALGLEGFSASLQAGGKLTDVVAAILSSTEHGPAITDPTTYVQSLYANTLHRGADGGGLSYYTNELNSGISQATVAVQIASSSEAQQVNAQAFSTGVFVTDAIDAAVARLYYGVLGRTPDATGLSGFEMQVKQAAAASGVNGAIQGLAAVANAMLGSQEYGATHAGQSNAAFVDSVYVGALGRHADAGGSAFFTNELAQGVSQAMVALQIAQSPEAQVHLIGQIELGWHLA